MSSIAAACAVCTLAAATAFWGSACGSRGPAGAATPTASASIPAAEGVALAAGASTTTLTATSDEVGLVTGMIDQHLMGVLMGESCLEKAAHDELRSLCESLVATEGAAVRDLQSRQERYHFVREPEMTPAMERQIAKLSGLRGADFELELMQAMLRHHQHGATAAHACAEKAHDPELVRLCQDAAATQLAAVARARTWLCSWYGRC